MKVKTALVSFRSFPIKEAFLSLLFLLFVSFLPLYLGLDALGSLCRSISTSQGVAAYGFLELLFSILNLRLEREKNEWTSASPYTHFYF